jgi:hypothetical protein
MTSDNIWWIPDWLDEARSCFKVEATHISTVFWTRVHGPEYMAKPISLKDENTFDRVCTNDKTVLSID